MTPGKARALGPASALDELVLDRVADQRRRRIGVELLQRRSAMHLDRLDADRENLCDLSVRPPFGDELDHGFLASGQRSLARFFEQKALEQRLRYLAGEEGLVISQCLDGGDQEAAGVGLEEKSARTGLEHVPDEGIRIVHREDQDFDSRKPGADLPRRLNAVERRKAKIENGDVGAGSESKLDGLLAVGGFRDDLPTRLRMQDRAQPGAHYVVIVCDQYPRHWSAAS